MKTKLYLWVKTNWTMLSNAGSLIGTTAVTSILGFVYWWIAARYFPPETVGIASAAISAMMLLGGLCMLGFGTLLITELPRQPGQEGPLISTALIVVSIVGGGIGSMFALIAPSLSASFAPLRANAIDVVTFASGVSLSAATLVLDQALVGLLQGGLQLWRNTLFAIGKLVVLFVAGLWLSGLTGMSIYATWAIGNVLSLLPLAVLVIRKRSLSARAFKPQWSLLKKLGLPALQHHLLNMTLQAPTLALPILVTALLSARMNAWFYVSWMIASFVFVIPQSLTIVLHAMNSAQQATLAQKARVTIGLAVVASILTNCLIQLASKQVLSLFGATYAAQATWTLRILGLAAFPLIIKYHYISICRIQDRITQAMLGMAPGGLLELSAAALGAYLGNLTGLSLGWLIAICVESVFMFPTVYKVLRDKAPPANSVPSQDLESEIAYRRETNASSTIELTEREPVIQPLVRLEQKQTYIYKNNRGFSEKKALHLKPLRLVHY